MTAKKKATKKKAATKKKRPPAKRARLKSEVARDADGEVVLKKDGTPAKKRGVSPKTDGTRARDILAPIDFGDMSTFPAEMPSMDEPHGLLMHAAKHHPDFLERRHLRRMAEVVRVVGSGNPVAIAASTVGAKQSQIALWQKQGAIEKEKGLSTKYTLFHTSMLMAFHRMEVLMVKVIEGAAQYDWRAAAWWLSRRVPERYGDRVAQNIQVDDGAQKVRTYTTAALRAAMLIETMAEARQIEPGKIERRGGI